jgi:RimJ/RimL family protein N-acetyltransferase
MKYRNAAELLPPQLLSELQNYAQGVTFYVPKVTRKPWGEGTGAKVFFSRRDRVIRNEFSNGAGLEKLSGEYFISPDAVKKIVYKGADKMNAVDYSKYFWQNDWVRVRRAKPEDWKHNYHNLYYSEDRFFTDYEQELPWDEETRKENFESYIKSNWNSNEHIILIFESHAGEYVGGGNLHGINERHGTFGMYVYADDERYAIAGAKLMLEYAFNERRLNNCHTGFIENDTTYQPVFEKLGFKLEGTRRQQVFHKGKYWDENLYGLLASEFNAQK